MTSNFSLGDYHVSKVHTVLNMHRNETKGERKLTLRGNSMTQLPVLCDGHNLCKIYLDFRLNVTHRDDLL